MASLVSRPALVGFSAWFAVAGLIGERWPSSRFPMYAEMAPDGAIPVLLVDGEPVPPEALVDFHGCPPDRVRIPKGTPTRMGWRQDEIQRWVASHTADAPGDVTVRFGHVTLVADPAGPRLADDFVLLCEGTARRPR